LKKGRYPCVRLKRSKPGQYAQPGNARKVRSASAGGGAAAAAAGAAGKKVRACMGGVTCARVGDGLIFC